MTEMPWDRVYPVADDLMSINQLMAIGTTFIIIVVIVSFIIYQTIFKHDAVVLVKEGKISYYKGKITVNSLSKITEVCKIHDAKNVKIFIKYKARRTNIRVKGSDVIGLDQAIRNVLSFV